MLAKFTRSVLLVFISYFGLETCKNFVKKPSKIILEFGRYPKLSKKHIDEITFQDQGKR